MRTFRIARRKWAEHPSGSGLAGRWNRDGDKVIYTSSSLSLALLEILVHVTLDQVPSDYVWIAAEFDDQFIEPAPNEIPEDTAEYGSQWLRTAGGKPVLEVPSVIVPERNFLLNPDHTEFANIKWSEAKALEVDPRLTRSEAKTLQSIEFARTRSTG